MLIECINTFPSLLDFPRDNTCQVESSFSDFFLKSFDLDLTQQLQDFAQQHQVTIELILFSSFNFFITRYSEQRHFLLGVANDQIQQGAVFVLPITIEDHDHFLHQLNQTKHFFNAQIPSELLLDQRLVENSFTLKTGHHPLIQTALEFQHHPAEKTESALFRLSAKKSNLLDFSFSFLLEKDNILLKISYRTDLFSEKTPHYWFKHYQQLLRSCLQQPEQTVTQLNLLTPEIRQQLLFTGNQTQSCPIATVPVPAFFEQQAQQNPQHIAVTFERETLTYQQLNCQANQLAHYLHRIGVQPEMPIAVFLPTSLAAVVAIIAIVKAGAAYVPLDPDYPSSRLVFLLNDAEVKIILTTQVYQKKLPNSSAHILCLDQDFYQQELATNLALNITPEQLIYIIYTSGSTGQPKGVLITHRNLCNVIQFDIKLFKLNKNKRVLQAFSFNFDAASAQLWMALSSGATLCLTRPETVLTVIQEQAVTHAGLTPSLLNTLPEVDLPKLETITVGGEICTLDLVKKWGKNRAFFNLYGPTEATIYATYDQCEIDQIPTLGRPIANVQVYILDSYLEPLPIGVIGELYIGGIGVASGYLNRPELTAQSFLNNPLIDGDRLYRTGDRARWRIDGRLEFCGRRDQQVKIRGLRLELGEINQLLQQHSAVKIAIVKVESTSAQQKHLIAYIVPKEFTHQEQLEADLTHYLAQQLPKYALPEKIVILEKLPLTPNGKLDEQALFLLSKKTSLSAIKPRNPLEQFLSQLWQTILLQEPPSIFISFLTLGGDSIKAIMLLNQLQEQLKIEISLADILTYATIADFAHFLQENYPNIPEKLQADYHEIKEEHFTPVLAHLKKTKECIQSCPMSFAQQQLWLLLQLQENNTAYNLPITLVIKDKLDFDILQQSLSLLVQRHDILRTCFGMEDKQPLQFIYPNIDVTLPYIDLRTIHHDQQLAQIKIIVQQFTEKVFNLTQVPLWRWQLLQLADEHYLLHLVLHHLISDGWSIYLLQSELNHIYESLIKKQNITLPALTLQYADFALWQRQYLTEMRLNTLTEFWQKELKNAKPLLKLPLDFPRSAQQHYQGDLIQVTLDPTLTTQLKQLSQKEDVTLFMLLLASLQVLFYRYYGQTDISIGTPLSNRYRLELEAIMGFFINTIVIRNDLSGNPHFNHTLKQVRQRVLAVYAHQDMPFEKLIDMTQTARSSHHSPLFQVLLVLHNTPPFSQGLFQFEHHDIAIMGNKYDLNWHFWDKESELVAKIYYNQELFKKLTLETMLIHWQNLLKSIVTDPTQHLDQLNLLSESERLKFPIYSFDSNELKQESLIDAWLAQVKRTPTQSALHTPKVQWTYQDLFNHVRYCVVELSALALPNESRIIILSGEDHEVITALLAGLWLGHIVVPLEHNQPLRRLIQLIQKTDPACLLYPSNMMAIMEKLSQNIEIKAFNLSRWLKPNASPCPEPRAKADTLAYLLYTSGSTGEPKGILQNHRNALHFARVYRSDIHIADRWLFSSRYSVDNWVLDLIGALLRGVTLYPYALIDNGLNQLYDFIENNKITVFHNTPTVFKKWLDSLPKQQRLPDSLRLILLGGEPITAPIFLAYQQHATAQCRLVNGYGLTEASSVLQHTMTLTDTFYTTFAPMGKLQPGMAIQLVNAEGQNTQIYGEIVLMSPYLAVGYWQNGQINREKFPIDLKNPSIRHYRTGDLARLRADGDLEYLGRSDFQLKSHGFRIEPEEIEQLLKTHPDIQNAVVQKEVENTQETSTLVAYLVLNTIPRLALKKELQNLLREHFPDYMIPQLFVQLSDIPLTPSGKINRHALPASAQLPVLPGQQDTVTARTEIEQQLCAIWQFHLQQQPIGIYDNFFDLGGNSLLALTLLADIERRLNVKHHLPLTLLFQAPTIAELAERLENNGHFSLSSLQIIRLGNGSNPLIFLGSMARAQHLASVLPKEQTIYGFNMFAFEHRLSVPISLYDVVQEYADELQKQGITNYSILGYCADSRIALALAHVLQQRGQLVDFLGFIDFGRWRRPRWQRHWENARRFGWVNYSRHKLYNRFNISYLLKQLHLKVYHYRQFYLKQTIQLSTEYQTLQFIGQFERLRNSWPLKPWPGKIHFFLSEEMLPEHTDEFSALAQQGVELHPVSGFHLSLFTLPHLKNLADAIDAVLNHKK
ncbi:hypothetical protein TPSD3_07155 [Thioflexithrix psekupsensis]|uniref:Carrier domain-containing protein n=2 Tax=Thioflexithrix psekupsensis TaxID=1570016 RepID=A0A251X845_9GAMM|nr:hypothetical protein TPSD3_07155 [Thioflexithrix psekupsensis]